MKATTAKKAHKTAQVENVKAALRNFLPYLDYTANRPVRHFLSTRLK